MNADINLDDTTHCPLGDQCWVCGTTDDLAVAIYGTALGVYCDTLCGECAHAGTAPRGLAATTVMFLVMVHCEHLGIDIDQMAAVLDAEQAE